MWGSKENGVELGVEIYGLGGKEVGGLQLNRVFLGEGKGGIRDRCTKGFRVSE